MKAGAMAIPQFEIKLVADSESAIAGQGVQVKLSIQVSLKETTPPAMVRKGSTRLHCSVLVTTNSMDYLESVPHFLWILCNAADLYSGLERFRRVRVDMLAKGSKTFEVSVILVKPSQRIQVLASCDDIGPPLSFSTFPVYRTPETVLHQLVLWSAPSTSRRLRPINIRYLPWATQTTRW